MEIYCYYTKKFIKEINTDDIEIAFLQIDEHNDCNCESWCYTTKIPLIRGFGK